MRRLISKAYWQDKDMEIVIGKLLRYGVLASCIVILTGGIIYLARHSGELTHYHTFAGETEDLITIRGIVDGILHLHGKHIIQLGVLILIATPVARILFSVVGFAIEKDQLYVVLTLVVLLIITISIAGGWGG